MKTLHGAAGWVRANPHSLAMLYFVFYLVGFFSLEQLNQTEFYLITCPLDDLIPFCEWFILPYGLWFLVMPGSLIYFMFREKDAFLDLAFIMFTGMTFCLALYLVWPNGLDLRVDVQPDNWAARLVIALQGFDTPTNVCPSIHVSSTVAVELAVRHSESFKRRPIAKAVNSAACLSICLATMFLKQHSVVDVVAGIALSLVLAWAAWHTDWRGVLAKTPLRVLLAEHL